MSLLEDGEDEFDDLLDGGRGVFPDVCGEDGRAAELESCGEVAVDVGDGTTIEAMLVIASKSQEKAMGEEKTIKRSKSGTESRSHQVHILCIKVSWV